MGRVKFITTILLSHFFRNSQQPENEVFLLRMNQLLLPASISILLKNSLRKTSLFVLFELLPTGLRKYYGLLLPHIMNGLIIFRVFWQEH